MYRVAICDDNVAEGQYLLDLAKHVLCERNIEAEFSVFADPDELLAERQRERSGYDLILLDMLFDHTNGIRLAKALRAGGEQGAIIYTTSSRDYAIDGYKVQASDYLVKPIEKELLAESLERVLRRNDALMVEAGGVLKNILISDIEYVESAGNYVGLWLANQGEAIRMRATLSEALEKLGMDRFIRCHKGYLVNLGQVREVGLNYILLQGGKNVPLGRQYRVEFQKRILDYMEKAIPH